VRPLWQTQDFQKWEKTTTNALQGDETMTWHNLAITCPDCAVKVTPTAVEANANGFIRITLYCKKCKEYMRWSCNMAHLISVSTLLDHGSAKQELLSAPVEEKKKEKSDKDFLKDMGIEGEDA